MSGPDHSNQSYSYEHQTHRGECLGPVFKLPLETDLFGVAVENGLRRGEVEAAGLSVSARVCAGREGCRQIASRHFLFFQVW